MIVDILRSLITAFWIIAVISVFYTDIKDRIIKNTTSLAIAILGVAGSMFSGDALFYPSHLWALTWLFLGALALVLLGLWGAGDAKLTVALALGLPGQISEFLFITALCGGVVSLFMLTARLFVPKLDARVPYGVALGSGAMIVRFYLSY